MQTRGNMETGMNLRPRLAQGKPVRAVNTKTDFQNMEITNHQYMTKVFQHVQKKLGINRLLNIRNGSTKDRWIIMEIVHLFVNESSQSSWTKMFRECGSIQEHELRQFIQYHTETEIGTF